MSSNSGSNSPELQEALHRALVEHLAALGSGPGPEAETTTSTGRSSVDERPNFSLRELHADVVSNRPELAVCDYSEFRQLIYKLPTNERLATLGLRVVLDLKNGKVERNRYRVERLEAAIK
ncbi:MAG: hypothetical protein AAF420_08970 [Pseudomonadota bacterium]